MVSLNWKLKAVYAQSCHCFFVCLSFVCLFCLLYGISWNMGFPGGSDGKESMWETWAWSLSQEDPLEKGMTTHSSTLAQRIPWTEEPGGLQSIVLQRVGHNERIRHTKLLLGQRAYLSYIYATKGDDEWLVTEQGAPASGWFNMSNTPMLCKQLQEAT